MDFKLELHNRNIPDENLLSDIKRVANFIDVKITQNIYKEHGKYAPRTIANRFKSWNKALELAGIAVSRHSNITEPDLFKNMESVWIKLGRQPKYDEMKYPLSKYSVGPYHEKFGRWNQALEKFVNYINTEDKEENNDTSFVKKDHTDSQSIKHKTKRNLSDRLRFRILMRDGFTCKSCGRSPVKDLNVELHVDHIIPWSKGGETIPENLETKCEKCNLGKGNAFEV
jgi:5-methylcytosine-specific restriction endonuclease McrA